MRVLILALAIALLACTDEEAEWEKFAKEHDCHEGIKGAWKCSKPTPSWWFEVTK